MFLRITCRGLILVAVSALCCGCSGGTKADDGGDEPTNGEPQNPVVAQSGERTLSGRVSAPNGDPLPGVTVSVGNPTSAVTDANGFFVILAPEPGLQLVTVDGSTSTTPGRWAPLVFDTFIAVAGESHPPTPLVLTDLDDGESAVVDVDGTGETSGETVVGGGDLSLTIPDRTECSFGETPAAADFELTIAVASGLPEPLPQGLTAAAIVALHPAGLRFDGGILWPGVDACFPNPGDFAEGSEFEIWRYDENEGAWVNDSGETGEVGVVVGDGQGGTKIQVDGGIVACGWIAAATRDPASLAQNICEPVPWQTELRLRVVWTNAADEVVPLVNERVHIYRDTDIDYDMNGKLDPWETHKGETDGDGRFTLFDYPCGYIEKGEDNNHDNCYADEFVGFVHCYDDPQLVKEGYTIDIRSAGPDDKLLYHGTFGTAGLNPDGVTNVGELHIQNDPTSYGSIAGRIVQAGAAILNSVTVTRVDVDPPQQIAVLEPDAQGNYHVGGIEEGTYEVSVRVGPQTVTTTVEVLPGEIATTYSQDVRGQGDRRITVRAVTDHDVNPQTPYVLSPGVRVTLVGTDPGSVNGLTAITGADGTATFHDVSGPFDITGQLDIQFPVPPISADDLPLNLSPENEAFLQEILNRLPRGGKGTLIVDVPFAVRTAVSLLDIDPPADLAGTNLPGTITLPFMNAVDNYRGASGLDYETVLNCSIAGIPNDKFYAFEVNAGAVGPDGTFYAQYGTSLDPVGTDGNPRPDVEFQMKIKGGVKFDAVLTLSGLHPENGNLVDYHTDVKVDQSGASLRFVVPTHSGVPSAELGDVIYSGLPEGTQWVQPSLAGYLPNGGWFEIPINVTELIAVEPLGQSLLLTGPLSSQFSNVQLGVGVDDPGIPDDQAVMGVTRGSYASLPISSLNPDPNFPATVHFIAMPEILYPVLIPNPVGDDPPLVPAPFTPEEAHALEIEMTTPEAGTGFNSVSLVSAGGIGDGEFKQGQLPFNLSVWHVVARSHVGNFPLPPVAKGTEMFDDISICRITAGQVLLNIGLITFDQFFGENFEELAKLADADTTHDNSATTTILILDLDNLPEFPRIRR